MLGFVTCAGEIARYPSTLQWIGIAKVSTTVEGRTAKAGTKQSGGGLETLDAQVSAIRGAGIEEHAQILRFIGKKDLVRSWFSTQKTYAKLRCLSLTKAVQRQINSQSEHISPSKSGHLWWQTSTVCSTLVSQEEHVFTCCPKRKRLLHTANACELKEPQKHRQKHYESYEVT